MEELRMVGESADAMSRTNYLRHELENANRRLEFLLLNSDDTEELIEWIFDMQRELNELTNAA